VRWRTEGGRGQEQSSGIVTVKEPAMPTGASPKREREFKEIKSKFKKEGRYPGREEEVAARIVNKQRAEHGETKEAAAKRKH
jgi:hypothetical protein